MSTLYLVHGFSPDSAALPLAFLRNARLLDRSSIGFATFNPRWNLSAPTHKFLWVPRAETRALPPHVSAAWADIAEKLDSGKNVLLFTRGLEPESHSYFWAHLAERVDLARHEPEVLFILGKPALLFEEYFRGCFSAKEVPHPQRYRRQLEYLAPTVKLVAEHAGNSRCQYLPDTSDGLAVTPRQDLLEQVFAFLGCPAPEGIPPVPYGTGFRSHQTRRISLSFEVRDNAWPALDHDACLEALLKVDRDLPHDWLAPLELRQAFGRTAAASTRALEAMAGASPGSLAPPAAFLSEPAADLKAPLSPGLAEAFGRALRPAERRALRARLANDEVLLDADQRALQGGLSASDEFVRVGDAVPPPELTVLTMTYNHENFIAECMDSVLAQKTDFPVRHLVLDHCSTDGTAAIVAEYASKYPSIRPVLLSRHVPHENVTGLFLRCRSKYAALCDGDDYFTEPTKLQKQVDMLEANPGLALCFHPVAAVFEDGSPPVIFPPLSNLPKRSRMEFYLADLMKGNFIQTNSVVYRWRFREGLPAWFRPDLCPGDFYWHMLHAETGKIGFIPEIMSVYRRHSGALYAKAFTSSKELRRDHGFAELEAYHAYNEHFGNRYFRALSRLANGVFADFLHFSIMENDDRLFNAAVENYPDFAKSFLHDLKSQNGEMAAQGTQAPTPGGDG